MSVRTSTRPNSLTRFGIRLALLGRPCSTCLLPVAWDGLQGRDRMAWSADLGHRIALDVCGSWASDVVGVQCYTCNADANAAGIIDQSAWWVSAPYRAVPRPVAKAARATWVPEDGTGLPGREARRAARKARGMHW